MLDQRAGIKKVAAHLAIATVIDNVLRQRS